MTDLSVRIGKSTFKNPVFSASGTFGYGIEYSDFFDISRLGAVIVKGLSIEPVKGNPGPRIFETASGMVNAIGLQNIGVKNFVSEILPILRSLDATVIANVYGKMEEEYAAVAAILDDAEGVEGLELNISCPNVKKGGIVFGQDPIAASKVVQAVKRETDKTIIVKLSPNVSDITEIAGAVEEGGADGISLINTLLGMVIDLDRKKSILGNVMGGLSGPAIKPVALRMVYQVAQRVSVPVIGIGGIMNERDALEFMLAGATAIQVGTANFINPRISEEILDGIKAYFDREQIERVGDFTGTLKT
ncbi:MAG: dihydroorotate dehydrogenase [Deltaproteobacteria bacterium]|nr:dihydroorotate dehydrogenase [Deltaproteobacteria bacterium]NIS76576.1 dihydroorotate dehydrogenase [Deltaproteobacteria bacterium]